MKFCSCRNLLFQRTIETPEKRRMLIYYCESCGFEEKIENMRPEDMLIYRSKYDQNDTIAQTVVGPYTKLDPTLPRVNNITCPNDKCPGHNGKIANEVIYILYNRDDMKYIYLCVHCDMRWTS